MRRKSIIIVSILVVIVVIVIGIGLDIVKACPAVGCVTFNRMPTVNVRQVASRVECTEVRGVVPDELHFEVVLSGVGDVNKVTVLHGANVDVNRGLSVVSGARGRVSDFV
ncbi:MAG TPA: hypothetical protein VF131_02090 [Blastocatellia bacterium]|nr:hypothetical protein [Blastocatellia bacterium]